MKKVALRIIALSAAVGASLGSVAFAATPVVSGDRLTFAPEQSAIAYQLRLVAPNGATHEDLFMGDEPIRVSLRKLPGGGMDGTYTYEITPIRGMKRRGERQAGGGTSTRAATAESGFLRMVDGRLFVGSEAREGRSPLPRVTWQAGPVMAADQVIPEALIVQDSICAGFDCVNGEVFGTDTLRLKENNLRIDFHDTSTTAGYPAADWRLAANDTTSGGANRFSIEDSSNGTVPFTVLAGAPSNSLFVDSTGNVGLNTAAPGLELHLSDSDTPAVRLEQTGAGGFTPQTWDIGGNEANFFVRDLTGGSLLSFRIRPGAPTSSIDINGTGDVGIGTPTPTADLDISRQGDVAMRLSNTNASGVVTDWELRNNVATGRLTISDDPARVRVPIKIAPLAADNLLRVGIDAVNTVDINGNLDVSGNLNVAGTITPDYVFEEGFPLPSIREHAAAMWAHRHLPKVGPARTNDAGVDVIDVGARSQGMLEELEYAHIYIAQLHEALEQVRVELDAVKAALDRDQR